jgi:hypothetical protein
VNPLRKILGGGTGLVAARPERSAAELLLETYYELQRERDRGGLAEQALAAILAGEPATDDDYRAAAGYAALPPGQLDDGQIKAAAALERMRRIGAQPPTSPQPTDTTTGEQA